MRISDWSSDVCASPHAYTLRPSDARALAAANLVLWIGPSLETFLDEPLATLAQPGAAVELLDSEGLTLHDSRSGGGWDLGSAQRRTPGTNAHLLCRPLTDNKKLITLTIE